MPIELRPLPAVRLISNRWERSSATLNDVTNVHQCPYCELRFGSRNELQDHVACDHPRELDDDTDPRTTRP
ncbi:MAG: C2H2-type zinc finger protein [Acidimicrobiales bacterium]